MTFERRGSQNAPVYRVHDDGRYIGSVRKQWDGTWFALRATGPRDQMVHSPGHRTRRSAAEALA